jgi:formiminotetrahydrofolate cyclodeaminase
VARAASPKESSRRRPSARRIAEANVRATQVPMRTPGGVRLLAALPDLAEKGNPNAVSTPRIGRPAARGGNGGGPLNVGINLSGIADVTSSDRCSARPRRCKPAQRLGTGFRLCAGSSELSRAKPLQDKG